MTTSNASNRLIDHTNQSRKLQRSQHLVSHSMTKLKYGFEPSLITSRWLFYRRFFDKFCSTWKQMEPAWSVVQGLGFSDIDPYTTYEGQYHNWKETEEVVSHFVDFEGDQIAFLVLWSEQWGLPMGCRGGLRRLELKCFNSQGPHMVSKCTTKHEYYNQMEKWPRHPPLKTPPQPLVQSLTQ